MRTGFQDLRSHHPPATRPYYRPFGRHNRPIDDLAGGLGDTRTMMWNGSFSDSEVVTTQFLLAQAAKYLQLGVINLRPRLWGARSRARVADQR
jgi:hypothetical protein